MGHQQQFKLFKTARKQNRIQLFSVVDEMSLSIAAVSGLLATCSMLAEKFVC